MTFKSGLLDNVALRVGIHPLTHIHDDNATPFCQLREQLLNNSSVDITTRVWCNSSDFFGLKTDLTRNVKEAFDKASITIPYPHMQVVMQAKAGETA